VSFHRPAALALSALLVLGASACGAEGEAVEPAPSSSPSPSSSTSVDAAPVAAADARARIADGARVIDVRTAEEFDGGHLDGALHLDAQQDDFAERVGELPREAAYVVYCASGRRATGAVETMLGLGFTDVVNGGGYTDLVEE